VRLGHPLHDGEPEPGPAGGPAARRVDPVEAVEDARQVLRADPDAVVDHVQARPIGAARAHVDPHVSS